MTNLEIKKSEVYETWLKYDYVKEKLEKHEQLKDLYNQVLWFWESEKKTLDLSWVKNYLTTIQDYDWKTIQEQWATWSFAVQLFLKSQWLYEWKVDWLYLTKGKESESKTRSAVRKFQEANWFTGKDIDWRAGKETIKKMLEVMNQKPIEPETNIDKILLNTEIASEFAKLDIIKQWEFKAWRYSIETDKYSYKIEEWQLHRTNKPIGGWLLVDELLLVNGSWKKSETLEEKKENEKPIEDKTPVVKIEEPKSEKLLDGVAYTWKDPDFQKYLEKEYWKINNMNSLYASDSWPNLEKNLLSKNEEKISKDTKFCTYMLYKAMKWAWTNKKLVSRIFENYEWSFNSLSILFWKPSWKDVFDYVDSEYFNKKDLINLLNKQLEKAKSKPSKEDIDLIESNIKKIKEKYMME